MSIDKASHTRKYPEAAKVTASRSQMQAIGEFIDWLWDEGLFICDKEGDRTHLSIETLLARHFGIDQKKYEEEKLAMLEELRDNSHARVTTERRITKAITGLKRSSLTPAEKERRDLKGPKR